MTLGKVINVRPAQINAKETLNKIDWFILSCFRSFGLIWSIVRIIYHFVAQAEKKGDVTSANFFLFLIFSNGFACFPPTKIEEY
jgi:hypothetical protein